MSELNDLAYVPGTWVAVSATHGWLLADLVPEDPLVRRCWKLMSDESGADAVLDALAAGGIAAAPSFALVVVDAMSWRVVVRSPASVAVHRRDHDVVEFAAAPAASWADVMVHEVADGAVDAVTLTGPATSAVSFELPTGVGVTTASVLHLRAGAPSERPTPPSAPMAEVPVAESAPADEPSATPVRPTAESESGRSELPAPPGPAEAAAPIESAEPVEPSYDHLFGASEKRVPAELGPTPVPASGLTEGWVTGPPLTAVDTPAQSHDPGGLIEGVPWARPVDEPPKANEAPKASAQPTSIAVPMEAEDRGYEATVNRAQLQAAMTPNGPTVLAGFCPHRHLSPPYATHCRVCAAEMPSQDAFEIARPPLGLLRMPSGDKVTLDRGALLGRSPDVPSGYDRPHVVRLTSPDNDISRNHAEIVLDGWNVYVRDLGSTNGTVVELRGQNPVRLHENDLKLLEDGARVILADEITVVFEVSG